MDCNSTGGVSLVLQQGVRGGGHNACKTGFAALSRWPVDNIVSTEIVGLQSQKKAFLICLSHGINYMGYSMGFHGMHIFPCDVPEFPWNNKRMRSSLHGRGGRGGGADFLQQRSFPPRLGGAIKPPPESKGLP